MAGHGANIISHVIVHPCAKFEVILTMLGELLVHKCSGDVYMINSHLNFGIERLFIQVYYLRVAGLLVYIEILFLKFYYSHGQCS